MQPIATQCNQGICQKAIWPAVLLVDALAIGSAVLVASLTSILAVLVLTGLVTILWILKLSPDASSLLPMLAAIGGFGLFFFIAGIFAGRKVQSELSKPGIAPPGFEGKLQALFGRNFSSEQIASQIPALSAVLPFLLLMMVTLRLPLSDPSPDARPWPCAPPAERR